MMAKIWFYNFIPTKAEEEAAKAQTMHYQVTRILVEINDIGPGQFLADPNYPWLIRKAVGSSEIMTEKLMLSHNDIFHHTYLLGWLDIVQNRVFNSGDEVGLLWDIRTQVFHFKLLRRGD
ncbi:hypothetical protein ACJRO7_031197 [Eucalyptus globulus]|uniref:Uncharacterized protein n=1 Tax=Eucalyptus globulus TaxID=34317 RepID=A0ABD3JRY3_EUCGL